MQKKQIKTLAIAACLLAGAASAHAATDINIYGASAQYVFLRNVANDILIANGCSNADISSGYELADGSEYIITAGTSAATSGNCLAAGGYTLRLANKSSRDGIKTSMGQAAAGGCATVGQAPFLTAAGDLATTCLTVTMGASDVAAATYSETTNGCEYGPVLNALGYCTTPNATAKKCTTNAGGVNDGTAAFPGDCYRAANVAGAITLPSGAVVKNPMILPFAFWVNNTVQVSKCSAADSNAGHLCKPVTGEGCATAANCTTGPIDNVSRIMVANIFGKISTDWTDFGAAYTSTAAHTKIRACLRQAGSGSLATLNEAVMNNGKWGKALIQTNSTSCIPGAGTWPGCLPKIDNSDAVAAVWFASSTDDMLHCVNLLQNAIGFSDADACTGTSPYTNGVHAYAAAPYSMPNLCSNLHMVTYNGTLPTRDNVRNGLYDFWTLENLYINGTTYPAGSNEQNFFNTAISTLTPTVLTNTKVGDSANYWTSTSEMRWTKTADTIYPTKKNASIVVLP